MEAVDIGSSRAPAAAILVIIEESKNPVVDLDREIVSKFFDVVFDCFLELRIDQGGERFDVLQIVDCRMLFPLVCESIAFSQSVKPPSDPSAEASRSRARRARKSGSRPRAIRWTCHRSAMMAVG